MTTHIFYRSVHKMCLYFYYTILTPIPDRNTQRHRKSRSNKNFEINIDRYFELQLNVPFLCVISNFLAALNQPRTRINWKRKLLSTCLRLGTFISTLYLILLIKFDQISWKIILNANIGFHIYLNNWKLNLKDISDYTWNKTKKLFLVYNSKNYSRNVYEFSLNIKLSHYLSMWL